MAQNVYTQSNNVAVNFEKVPSAIFPSPLEASVAVAKEIANLIKQKQAENKPCVLGLATGNTPKRMYAELIRLHKEEGLSFKNVITFNLDEYYPMQPDAVQSYVRFMKEQLFNHVDIAPENYNVPDGTLRKEDIQAYCEAYENKINALGGLDLQVLGIGGTGHIGFNEPGSQVGSKTRLVALDYTTRVDATPDFGTLENVPRLAITLGVNQIMNAKRVVLMAWGGGKAKIVQKACEGEVTEHCPSTFLQHHPNATFFLDEPAAEQLMKVKTPWLVGPVEWTTAMIKKAVCMLALKQDKPILKLTTSEYIDNGLGDLLAQKGSAYEININVFNQLQNTISGWPGGKPHADDTHRPERALPVQKRVLIFSPHPDDDIISMGGTFLRLHEQGHDVHVGYQTSGNIAVHDDEALRFSDFVCDYNAKFGLENTGAGKIFSEAKTFLKAKKGEEKDIDSVRQIKGLIRKGEAKATCRYVGIPDENAHFMNLPFYETGTVKKNPVGEEDILITMDLIRKLKPQQIYAAGDLADPHGTHKVCLDAIFEACKRLKNEPFMKDCWVWLYRGAWHEWDIWEIEMSIPMSPEQVLQKRYGIFKHQSQKDGVVFQGNDSREFWQRAEVRNAGTAEVYNKLGLSEYAAMEAFVRWHY
jgi:glucosamine-6-phosphate deaminase